MKTSVLLPLFALALSSLAAAEPAPLLAWKFDEGSGNWTANTGTGGDADLYTVPPGGDAQPFFSGDRGGVSGKPGDYAFDLSSATGMGATTPASTGPVGVVWSNSPGLTSLSGLASFTLTGWIKPAVPVSSAARLVVSPTMLLMAGSENQLALQVNGTDATEQSLPSYSRSGSWMFFAVTYDGTRTTDNVTYYVGAATKGSLVPAGTTTLAAGKLKPFAGQLLIGNNSTTPANRPLKGLMDDIAIYGSTKDATGVLTLAQIEAVRAAALR